jgi:integrase
MGEAPQVTRTKARDYVAIAEGYAADVVSGKVPACQWAVKACRRQLDNLEIAKRGEFPYRFDHEKASRICRFIEMLPHIKGEWAKSGSRIELQPWQVFILTAVFGWVSRDTVRLDVAVLRAMLQEAVNEGILAVNPVMKLGRFYRSARRIKEKIDPFTIEEIHLLEDKCREKFPEHYAFVLCMARTGMRIGEVTALQWHDVDFANNYIVVRRNIPHHRQVETTKTEASQRKIDMSPELSAELMQLRTEKKKQALADGKAFDAEAWVFPSEDGTPIFYSNFLRRVWHKVQDQARVRRRTPHDLRHTWASHMLASGADLAYVSNQLGHANPSITLRIYSHWVPGMRRVTTAVLDRQNASSLQMEAVGGEMEISGRP